MTEEPHAVALPDATLAAFFVLFVAALFVAAWGLARLLRPLLVCVLPVFRRGGTSFAFSS